MVKRSPKARRRHAESKDDGESDDDAYTDKAARRSRSKRDVGVDEVDIDDDAGLVGKALLATSTHFGFDPEATLSTQWKERTSVSSPRRAVKRKKSGAAKEEESVPTAVVDLLNAACESQMERNGQSRL